MAKIIAYLSFNGNCTEAMNFYKNALNADLEIQTLGQSPMADQTPAEMKDRVLHSALTKGDLSIYASDMIRPDDKYIPGGMVALSIMCDSEDQIHTFYNNLCQDGTPSDPLTDTSWGAIFGTLTDKFGVRWMFNYDKNQLS